MTDKKTFLCIIFVTSYESSWTALFGHLLLSACSCYSLLHYSSPYLSDRGNKSVVFQRSWNLSQSVACWHCFIAVTLGANSLWICVSPTEYHHLYLTVNSCFPTAQRGNGSFFLRLVYWRRPPATVAGNQASLKPPWAESFWLCDSQWWDYRQQHWSCSAVLLLRVNTTYLIIS